ncbi:Uncharacterised protein [Klebsiella oxytoca]|nr:Uncharacterised protein [Klebsiella oxytoca]
MAMVTFFSFSPLGPMAPGSWPPWPASIATTTRSPEPAETRLLRGVTSVAVPATTVCLLVKGFDPAGALRSGGSGASLTATGA